MTTLSRRGFLTLGAGLIAAPAIVRASSIMRVKPVVLPEFASIWSDEVCSDVAAEMGRMSISHELSRYLVMPNGHVFTWDVDWENMV